MASKIAPGDWLLRVQYPRQSAAALNASTELVQVISIEQAYESITAVTTISGRIVAGGLAASVHTRTEYWGQVFNYPMVVIYCYVSPAAAQRVVEVMWGATFWFVKPAMATLDWLGASLKARFTALSPHSL
jgi:hypothetical protein